MKHNIKITSAILCEEVRVEKNNKYMILGVYAADILVSDIPAQTPLCFYVEFKSPQQEGDMFFRFSGPGKGVAKLKVHYKKSGVAGADSVAIAAPRMEVVLEQEGVFKLDWSEDGKSWKSLLSRRVIKSPDAINLSPIGPLQHFVRSQSDGPHQPS